MLFEASAKPHGHEAVAMPPAKVAYRPIQSMKEAQLLSEIGMLIQAYSLMVIHRLREPCPEAARVESLYAFHVPGRQDDVLTGDNDEFLLVERHTGPAHLDRMTARSKFASDRGIRGRIDAALPVSDPDIDVALHHVDDSQTSPAIGMFGDLPHDDRTQCERGCVLENRGKRSLKHQ